MNGLVPNCEWFICTFDSLIGSGGLIDKIMHWIVLIAVPAASIAIVWAGITMVIYSTNPGKREGGKKMLYVAILGIVIVLGSYVAVKTITDFFVKPTVVQL